MRLDLAVIEILLLGHGLFYGSFVATSAIFYGQEFAVPLAIGLPIVMLCGWSLVRKPFRTIVVVGVLSWIARPVISPNGRARNHKASQPRRPSWQSCSECHCPW